MRKLKVLRGHHSPETAFLVPDYPFGFRLRCKIRYWLATALKGGKKGETRFMSQTTNPKVSAEVWNKPKGSIYAHWMLMYQVDNPGAEDDGHVHTWRIDRY